MRILSLGLVLISVCLPPSHGFAQETVPPAATDQTGVGPEAVDQPEECFDENAEVIECTVDEEIMLNAQQAEDDFSPEEPFPDAPDFNGEIPAEPQ